MPPRIPPAYGNNGGNNNNNAAQQAGRGSVYGQGAGRGAGAMAHMAHGGQKDMRGGHMGHGAQAARIMPQGTFRQVIRS
jgi:hypothetical protein